MQQLITDVAQITTPTAINLLEYGTKNPTNLSPDDCKAQLARYTDALHDLQRLLYGAASHSVLLVLQGMDTSGKDGVVNHVCTAFRPTGMHVWSFETPTIPELHHDFLWRAHPLVPEDGMISILNRSYYEDVLIARVHNFVTPDVWQLRYQQINDFERLLASHNTIVLKFFLHISQAEQQQRLLHREMDPRNSWKLTVADWREREAWPEYQQAYEAAIGNCSTPYAPWYIIPADDKEYRNLLVSMAIMRALLPYQDFWTSQLEQRQAVLLSEIYDYLYMQRPIGYTTYIAPGDAER
jgi:PPK2 family polyphosphate:nucleotide phosphotransferase